MRRVGNRALFAAATVAATTAAMLFGGVASAGAATGDTGILRHVTAGADVSFPSSQSLGTPSGIQKNEFRPDEADGPNRSNSRNAARTAAVSPTGVPVVSSTPVAGSPGLTKSFHALDGFDQRYANGGNQFSVTPPDQGLCAGNGYVLEAVNDVLRVYRPTGSAASGITDLNSFFQYPAQIDRTNGVVGPEVTDPTCLFDNATQRWFVTVLTLDVNKQGNLSGANHIDVAVSKTANPLGRYTIYRVPVQDDGTAGTPRHRDCPCIGDYPHIGADKYAFFVSTNEYPLDPSLPGQYGNNFNGAQIYAFDKAGLVARHASVNVVQFQHTQLSQNGHAVPGFTLAPAQVPDAAFQTANNGTEYFLSSIAGAEAQPGGFTGQAASIGSYAVTNTKSISNASPDLDLTGSLRPSEPYVVPPLATQKLGPTPLANYCTQVDCQGFGVQQQFSEGPLATNDTRMLQVYYAGGRLYGALDTGVQVAGRLQAGIAWFLVNPGASPSTSSVSNQGYVGVAGQNVLMPAIAATTSGRGAMVYTLAGSAYYPSAAYSLVGTSGVTGAVHLAAAGVGPQDGFSEYFSTSPAAAPRPRWGDYSAAVPVGSSIWMATEYIGQKCSFATYQNDPTCGNTRAPLINWGTRIAAVTP